MLIGNVWWKCDFDVVMECYVWSIGWEERSCSVRKDWRCGVR
jgi:hypothetical protein